MTLSPHKKIVIDKILANSIRPEELVETYNQFLVNKPDSPGVIGWKILNRIADENTRYRGFIENFGEDADIQKDVGNFVHEIMRKKMGI